MTISYVGAGAASTGNNASVSPALPAGVSDGDLLLLVASIRNVGTGSVNTPDGWRFMGGGSGFEIEGRFYQAGDTAPTVTFNGGVAGADTIARVVALRGVAPDALSQTLSAAQENASAQDIAYPALDVPGDAYALLMALWKQDDASSLTTPAGWTAVGLTSTTTGDDAATGLFYQIQTTEADISSGSSTVTGGASAISRALLLALKPAAAIVVHEQDAWPPRVQIVLSGLTIGDSVTVYREVAGQRTAVRGGSVDAVTDTAYVTVDAELPFGVPVSYVAVVAGSAEYATTATTYTLPGGKDALSDAIAGTSAEVVVTSADPKVRARKSARFNVGGRNLMVSGPLGQPESAYELFVETTTARDNLFALLESATEGIVQIRQPLTGVYDGVDAYLAVDKVTESRWSQDGSDQRRLITIEYAEVDGWADTLTARGFSYGEVEAFYAGLTYADAAGDYATYLDAIQGDFS